MLHALCRANLTHIVHSLTVVGAARCCLDGLRSYEVVQGTGALIGLGAEWAGACLLAAHYDLTKSLYRATLRMDILWIFGLLGALWVSSWMDNPFSQVRSVLCVCSVATSLQHSLQCRSFVIIDGFGPHPTGVVHRRIRNRSIVLNTARARLIDT